MDRFNPANKRKKGVGIIVSIVFFGLSYFAVQQIFFKPQPFDTIMMKAASEINKSCPIMVDKDTRLDNAIALTDNTVQYNYTLVNWVKDSLDLEAFENYMQPMILNNVKTNPDLKIFRKNKTTMAYSYKDKKGEFVIKISITAEQYLD